MSAYRLMGARVVDPSREIDAIGDVFLDGNEIVETGGDHFVDVPCEGLVIAPGFVGLHSHLDVPAHDAAAALHGGFTTVLNTPVETVSDLQRQRAGAENCGVTFLQSGALSEALEGTQLTDMGSLLEAGATVLSNDRETVTNSGVLRNLLQYAAGFGTTVFLRPGDAALESGPVREGAISAQLGMRGTPPQAEAIDVWRLALLADLTGARVHLTHLWSAKGVHALRTAQSAGIAITGSTTVFHITQDPMQIASGYLGHWRTTPPLGNNEDRAELIRALKDGTLCAVAADHRPLVGSAQQRPFEFAESGAVTFAVASALAIEALGLEDAIRALAHGPANLLGRCATLAPGSPADLVVIDPSETWRYDATRELSSQQNTPLDGAILRSRVVQVFRDGQPLGGTALDPNGRPVRLRGLGESIQ